MKRSMLALAVLGTFAGTAAAQTSVTLYGLADVNVVYSKGGENSAAGDDAKWLVRDGGAQGKGGSRWGLRVSEDLGGGLRAYANLEQGFNVDDGTAADATRQFSRQAYVALGSKSLGDLRIGRQDSISRQLAVYLDPSDKGQIKIDDTALYETFGSRTDNTVAYISPSFGGFQVQVHVGAGEGSPNARYQGLAGTFKSGPVAFALGYEEYDNGSDTTNKTFNIGGNYNFGFAKFFAGYQKVSDPANRTGTVFTVNPDGTSLDVEDRDFWTVGASVPFGQITLLANYSTAKHDLVGGGDADIKKAGVAVEYALSKRTLVYSAYTYRGGDLADRLAIQQEFTLLGLRHVF